jgi:hypothetical protein
MNEMWARAAPAESPYRVATLNDHRITSCASIPVHVRYITLTVASTTEKESALLEQESSMIKTLVNRTKRTVIRLALDLR